MCSFSAIESAAQTLTLARVWFWRADPSIFDACGYLCCINAAFLTSKLIVYSTALPDQLS